MQPVTPIAQVHLNPVINEYLDSQKATKLSGGSCAGLVYHHCIKKFEGNEKDHFRICKQIAAEKLEGISKSDELQKFCHKIVKIQNMMGPGFNKDTIKALKTFMDRRDISLYSSYHLNGVFPLLEQSGSQIVKLLNIIVSIVPRVEKYIVIGMGVHVMGISVSAKDQEFNMYETTEPHPDYPMPLNMGFDDLFCQLSYMTRNKPLAMGIEVLSDKDISQEMSSNEKLKRLKDEILKNDPNQKTFFDMTPFALAMKYNCFDDAWELVNNYQADPSLLYDSGNTPLSEASMCGDDVAIGHLIRMKADINKKSGQYERFPLWWAARAGHLSSVKLLLANGADPLQTDKDNIAALDIAKPFVKDRIGMAKYEPELIDDNRYNNYCEIVDILKKAEAEAEAAARKAKNAAQLQLSEVS